MKIEKTIDSKYLPNCKPNWHKAYEYAKLMEQGVQFPPVNIFRDENGALTYNDGRHRVMASKLVNQPLLIRISDREVLIE